MSFLLYKKKNHSFLMSPTVGDLFKSPIENGTLVLSQHVTDKWILRMNQ